MYEITSEETAHQLGLRGGTSVFGTLWKTEDNALQVTASSSTNNQTINAIYKMELLELIANGKSYTNFVY